VAADLAGHLRGVATEPLAGLRGARLGVREVRDEVEVVEGDRVLEHERVEQVPQGLPEIDGRPRLVGVDAEDAVAQVLVLTDDVRVRVVKLVVAVLPHRGRGGVVPLPRGGVDVRVPHPVPLAVHDVVPDLHVLEDLRDGQARRADDPRTGVQREQQDDSGGRLEGALDADDPADVGRVVGTARGEDLLAQRVELAAQLVDLLR